MGSVVTNSDRHAFRESFDFQSSHQVDSTLANIESVEIFRLTRELNGATQEHANVFDTLVGSEEAVAQGTVTMVTPVDGDNFEVNGLTYTARDSPSLAGEFLIDSGDDNIVTAANCVSVINADTRVGTIGFVLANASTAAINVASSLVGTAGNVVTLTTAQGTITVSGATLSGGSATPTTLEIHQRNVSVPLNLSSPSNLIPSFFTNVALTPTAFSKLIAIPLRNRNGVVDYSIFWIVDTTDTAFATLFTGTVEVPEGTPPQFPFAGNAFNWYGQTFVKRSDRGGNPKIVLYDYFIIGSFAV